MSKKILEMTIRASSGSNRQGNVLKVERPYYEQEQLNHELNYCRPNDRNNLNICDRLHNVKPKTILFSLFPIFTWLSQYNFKNNIIHDVVSGCTVAVMHIPQGIS